MIAAPSAGRELAAYRDRGLSDRGGVVVASALEPKRAEALPARLLEMSAACLTELEAFPG